MSNGLCWQDVLKGAVGILREMGEEGIADRLEKCRIEARLCARLSGCDTYTLVFVTDQEEDADYLYNRGELIQEVLNQVLAARGCLCTDLLVRIPVPEGPGHLLEGLRRLVADSRDFG